jgi:hypothetical protein
MTEYSYISFEAKDIPVFVDYLWDLRAEFEELTSIVPIDKDAVEQRLGEAVGNGTALCIAAVDEANRPVGALILNTYSVWWTSSELLTNTFFFVSQKARRSAIARTFMGMAKELSEKTGKPLWFEVLSGPDTNFPVFERVFGQMGLKKIGTQFLYQPHDKTSNLHIR